MYVPINKMFSFTDMLQKKYKLSLFIHNGNLLPRYYCYRGQASISLCSYFVNYLELKV